MDTFVALLRGVNVGGSGRLPMSELRAALESLGARDVRTYVQSGNAVFRASRGGPCTSPAAIGAAIRERCGFGPEVLLLTPSDLERAILANPFPDAVDDAARLHVFFLATDPAAPNLEALDGLRAGRERWALRGRLLYLHAPDGLARSRLGSRLERTLGVTATARNWRSLCEIRRLASG